MQKIANSGIDRSDSAILNLVQRDNQMTHAEIGERIGLSQSSVRRRLARMRKEGTISRDISIVGQEFQGVTLIVTVWFAYETVEIYEEFERLLVDLDEVKQCYHVAGQQDYVLIVQVPDLPFFENWAKKHLMTNDAIKRYDTVVVWSCKKFETAVKLGMR